MSTRINKVRRHVARPMANGWSVWDVSYSDDQYPVKEELTEEQARAEATRLDNLFAEAAATPINDEPLKPVDPATAARRIEIASTIDIRNFTHDEISLVARYMADNGHTADEVAYAVEKPWKFLELLVDAIIEAETEDELNDMVRRTR